MAAEWKFDTRPKNLVEQDLTQRDQFNNDDVGIAEALVREVIQNSTDAGLGNRIGPVKVRFSIEKVSGSQAKNLSNLLQNLTPHLKQCGVNHSPMRSDEADLLVIEDFNTRGLTGSTTDLDNDNFHNFWRRHGRSVKEGSAGGRWGLGKIVYSASSQVRAFFGLTRRENDNVLLLMGQCVLSNHEIGNSRYTAFGFYSKRNEDDFQIPEDDPQVINDFRKLTGITRTDQPGLSIVIPYPGISITREALIKSVISNYYFPILAGDLVVEVNHTVIDAARFDEAVAAAGNHGNFPIDFVKSVSAGVNREPQFTGTQVINLKEIDENYFEADTLGTIRQQYITGDLVHVRLPVDLKPKGASERRTHIDVFIRNLPDNGTPYALFARGSITVPGEIKYFQSVRAFGAMVARDTDVVSFLGDAENPSHTAWNERAERLNARWEKPAKSLRAIRKALRLLYVIIAEEQERRYDDALIDFFSLADLVQSGRPKKKTHAVKPNPEVEPREKAFRIQPRKGGFRIVAGPAALKWQYPRSMTVQMAYDMLGSNPFRKHSKYDFDLEGKDITIKATNVRYKPVRSNTLKLKIESPEFEFEACGFDENRDLIVKARTE